MDDSHKTKEELLAEILVLRKALEKSNADLEQFTYVASHDLRAPLRGISNLSQWIEEDLGPHLGGESRRQMELLRGRVQRMESMIDGILDYSRAGRMRHRPERVEVGPLIREVMELLPPRAPMRFELGEGMPTLTTERIPLRQVFTNLLSNALKHARRDELLVRVEAVEAQAFHHFRVMDNGQGIAPQYHEKIWGLFQTLVPRDKVEGSGMGLCVVKKIVESRGGRAWVESAEGAGATFHFTWPKSEERFT